MRVFATTFKKENFFSTSYGDVSIASKSKLFVYVLKRFYVKIRLSLKKGFFMFKLRILYFYEFCLFISSFSVQLRLTLYCQNLVVRFVIFVGCLIIPFLFLIKCYAVTTTTTATGELCATWEPRGTTISNFSAVFMCVLVIFLFTLLSCFSTKRHDF